MLDTKMYDDVDKLRNKIIKLLNNPDLMGSDESNEYKRGYIDASEAILYHIQEILIYNAK